MEAIEEFPELCRRRRHFKLSISVQPRFPDTAPTGTRNESSSRQATGQPILRSPTVRSSNRDALLITIRLYPKNDPSFAGHVPHAVRKASSLY
jgi:hypothetical protein